MNLKDKNILITGSNRGIGSEIMIEFAASGANIFAHARKQTPEFTKFIEDLSEKYAISITPIYFDLIDSEAMKKELKKIILSPLNIDVLINSAGVASAGLFSQTSVSKIKEVFEINLFSQMELTQLVLKKMTRQKSGSIINIGSVTGLIMSEGQTAYATSKMALMTWTKILAAEYGRFGIRCNAVAPGLVETDMVSELNKSEIEYFKNHCILKRNARPNEIAKVVKFLASDDASFINGQIVRIDGGLL